MMEFHNPTPKQLEEHLAQGKRLHEKARKQIQDNERIMRLMEEGLKSLPLERDFVDRIKLEFDIEKENFSKGGEMLGMIGSVIKRMKDGPQEGDDHEEE